MPIFSILTSKLSSSNWALESNIEFKVYCKYAFQESYPMAKVSPYCNWLKSLILLFFICSDAFLNFVFEANTYPNLMPE